MSPFTSGGIVAHGDQPRTPMSSLCHTGSFAKGVGCIYNGCARAAAGLLLCENGLWKGSEEWPER
jgi:hypothetical protein